MDEDDLETLCSVTDREWTNELKYSANAGKNAIVSMTLYYGPNDEGDTYRAYVSLKPIGWLPQNREERPPRSKENRLWGARGEI